MKRYIFSLIALCLTLGVQAHDARVEDVPLQDQPMETFTVSNEREFVTALGSNRIVIIKDGTTLNLTKQLNNSDFFGYYGRLWTDDYYGERNGDDELIVSCDRFDGRQLELLNVHNLTIRGGKDCKIVVEPRYANVLNFYRCSHITLENLTVGHTEEGYCEGGVLYFENSARILVKNCDLYGCGTYGLEAHSTLELTMDNTVIRDCSYGIMILDATHTTKFIDCDFIRCREFSLVEINAECRDTRFLRCRFAQNKGSLFNLHSNIAVESCEIHHPQGEEPGNADSRYFGYADDNTRWFRDDIALESRPKKPTLSKEEQLAAIRKLYADAKKNIEQRKEAELPPDELVLTGNYMAAGAGPINAVTHYYFSGDYSEERSSEYYQTYFITRKFNVGAMDYYQELLYDDEGTLVFFFEKQGDNETRYYWGPDYFQHEVIKGERLSEVDYVLRLSQSLILSFTYQMNGEP